MFNRIFIFKVRTLQKEILLGNPRNLKLYHKSLSLPIDLVNSFLKYVPFLIKNYVLQFMSVCVMNIFVNNLDFSNF